MGLSTYFVNLFCQLILSTLSSLSTLLTLLKLVKTCQDLSKLVKTCQNLSKFVKSCQNLKKLARSHLILKNFRLVFLKPRNEKKNIFQKIHDCIIKINDSFSFFEIFEICWE